MVPCVCILHSFAFSNFTSMLTFGDFICIVYKISKCERVFFQVCPCESSYARHVDKDKTLEKKIIIHNHIIL